MFRCLQIQELCQMYPHDSTCLLLPCNVPLHVHGTAVTCSREAEGVMYTLLQTWNKIGSETISKTALWKQTQRSAFVKWQGQTWLAHWTSSFVWMKYEPCQCDQCRVVRRRLEEAGIWESIVASARSCFAHPHPRACYWAGVVWEVTLHWVAEVQ
jgi:hypothetical protein